MVSNLVLHLWKAPEGRLFHGQSVEWWECFFDVIAVELPEGLSTVMVDDFVAAATDLLRASMASWRVKAGPGPLSLDPPILLGRGRVSGGG